MRKTVARNLIIALNARRVWKNDIEITLSPLEYDVMAHLARRVGEVLTYKELWDQIWSDTGSFGSYEKEAVRAVIKRLRKKIGDNAKQQIYLVSVRGTGLRLRERTVQVISE